MASTLTISNANSYDVQIPLIGKDGTVMIAPAGSSIDVSVDAIEWYPASDVQTYYAKFDESEETGIKGITVGEVSSIATLVVTAVSAVDGSVVSDATITVKNGTTTIEPVGGKYSVPLSKQLTIEAQKGSFTKTTFTVTLTSEDNCVVIPVAVA